MPLTQAISSVGTTDASSRAKTANAIPAMSCFLLIRPGFVLLAAVSAGASISFSIGNAWLNSNCIRALPNTVAYCLVTLLKCQLAVGEYDVESVCDCHG